MQAFCLPRQATRSAAAVSCPGATESGEAARRREILARWQQARDDGLTADQAARAVNVPRSTLYRWQKSPEPRSRRPKRVRQPDWSPELVAAVREIRTDFPLWGKARITVLLHRRGHRVSESTVGRILGKLMEQGAVTPPATQGSQGRPCQTPGAQTHGSG